MDRGEEEEMDGRGREGRMTGTAGDFYKQFASGGHGTVEEAA